MAARVALMTTATGDGDRDETFEIGDDDSVTIILQTGGKAGSVEGWEWAVSVTLGVWNGLPRIEGVSVRDYGGIDPVTGGKRGA